jgi:DGQHR domain-containing protein
VSEAGTGLRCTTVRSEYSQIAKEFLFGHRICDLDLGRLNHGSLTKRRLVTFSTSKTTNLKEYPMRNYSYKCLKIVQRDTNASPRFVMFAAKVGEILSWAAIERFTPESQNGSQRIDKPYKIKAVHSFFEVNERNTIPTAVVLGFRPGKVSISDMPGCPDVNEISFSMKNDADVVAGEDNSVATVVDGQHRLLGMKSFNPELFVNVVGVLEADDVETAFQFIVINNKAAKVSSDHLRALSLHYHPDELADRLKNVRLNLNANLRFVGFANDLSDSPFKGILNLPNNKEDQQWIAPAAIEDAVNYIRSQKLPEFIEGDDMVLDIFFKIWATIRSKWQHLWQSGSKLFTKVSIVCLTQFLIDNLLRQYDWNGLNIFDQEKVQPEINKVVGVLSPEFWAVSTEWTAKGLDTQAGRKLLLDALEQMVRNNRQQEPWYSDIGMIRLV